jgi:hypothetical protein
MPIWLRAAGIGGSILVLIALLITFLKQLISLIGFITVLFKVIIVLAFVVVIVAVGLMVLRGLKDRRKDSHNGV